MYRSNRRPDIGQRAGAAGGRTSASAPDIGQHGAAPHALGRVYYRGPVFILYALVAGLVIGRLLGGRFDNLGALSFRWTWVAIAGLAVQVALFSGPVSATVGDAGAPLYVASTVAVLGFVLGNAGIAGMPIVALGAGLNLVAIAANGGTMPASGAALASLGTGASSGYINSRELVAPVLLPLGDVFALPSWMPFANVFSVGDVLVGAGIFTVIVVAMRRRPAKADSTGGSGASATRGLPGSPVPQAARSSAPSAAAGVGPTPPLDDEPLPSSVTQSTGTEGTGTTG